MQDSNNSIYDAVNLLGEKAKTIAYFAFGQQLVTEFRQAITDGQQKALAVANEFNSLKSGFESPYGQPLENPRQKAEAVLHRFCERARAIADAVSIKAPTSMDLDPELAEFAFSKMPVAVELNAAWKAIIDGDVESLSRMVSEGPNELSGDAYRLLRTLFQDSGVELKSEAWSERCIDGSGAYEGAYLFLTGDTGLRVFCERAEGKDREPVFGAAVVTGKMGEYKFEETKPADTDAATVKAMAEKVSQTLKDFYADKLVGEIG